MIIDHDTFSSWVSFSVVIMFSSAFFSMRVAGLAEDKVTHKLSKLYYVPARIFFILFPLNLLIYIVQDHLSDVSFWNFLFYLSIGVFWREVWVARKLGQNAVEFADNMGNMKKVVVLSLFFYSLFWLSRGLFLL